MKFYLYKNKQKILIYFLIFFCISIHFIYINCSSIYGHKSYSTLTDLFTAAAQDTVITFDRPGGLGFLPSYRIAIYGDGTVIYEGRDNVRIKKRIISKIDKRKMEKILIEFEEADFFNYVNGDSLYKNCNVTSSSATSVILSLKINGKFNYIEHNLNRFKLVSGEIFEVPEELQRLEILENSIDEILEIDKLIK
jgi:hypothetical protein